MRKFNIINDFFVVVFIYTPEKNGRTKKTKKKSKLELCKTLTFFPSKNKKNIVKHNTTEKKKIFFSSEENKSIFPFRKNPLDYFENEFKVKENTSKVSSKRSNIKKEDSINFRYRYHDFCTNSPRSTSTSSSTSSPSSS